MTCRLMQNQKHMIVSRFIRLSEITRFLQVISLKLQSSNDMDVSHIKRRLINYDTSHTYGRWLNDFFFKLKNFVLVGLGTSHIPLSLYVKPQVLWFI